MALRTDVGGASNFVLQEAISAYSDEAYTNAKKLTSTGIVGSNPNIDTSTETYIGQVRWFKPLNPEVNVASLTVATDGTKTTYTSDFLTYIKTVRTHGADKVNMQQVVTQQDGLAKISRDFAETRSQDEHDAVLAVLKGVAVSEALNGAGSASGETGLGGQTFTNDPTDQAYGFYVDLGAALPVIAESVTASGAQRAEGFLQAFGAAFKDYEPAYAYLITSPLVLSSFRSANLVDQTTVVDGNVEFETIFNGKFRLIQTRAVQSMTAATLTKINTGAGVDIDGAYTSFIVLPGALAMEPLSVPTPVEITRDGNKYMGGGITTIWYRWGYVLAPAGYNWVGSADKFPSNKEYGYAVQAGAPVSLIANSDGVTVATDGMLGTGAQLVTGSFVRKSNSALSLGILPVFHS